MAYLINGMEEQLSIRKLNKFLNFMKILMNCLRILFNQFLMIFRQLKFDEFLTNYSL